MTEKASGAPLTHGARVELRLRPPDSDEAVYDVTFVLPEGERPGVARAKGREIAIESGPEVPSWLVDFTRTLLGTTARGKATPADFPRRLTRWRSAPSG